MAISYVHAGAQEIAELRVKCDNAENGCLWEGTIGTIEGHVKSCRFVLLPCPNNCTSLGKMWKEQLDRHLKVCPNRSHACEYCGEKGTYTSITKEHDKVCMKKKVACAQCSLTVERGKIQEHRKVSCQCTVVPCKYNSIGCSVRLMRKDMQRHEVGDDISHLHVALEKLSLLTDQVVTLQPGESFAFKLSGFSVLKKTNQKFYSDPFYTCQRYKMRVLVDCNGREKALGTHVSVFVEILQGRYDSELQWPFSGAVSIVLLNQLVACSSHTKGVIAIQPTFFRAQVGSTVGIWQFVPHSELSPDSASNVRYLINDTLYFRVKVATTLDKPWLAVGNVDSIAMEMTQDFKTIKNQEKFNIKLQNYSATSSFIDGFHIDPGYKGAIVVNSNNTHLSISVIVSKRPYGHSLDMFSGTVQVELLNQLEDRNHRSKYLELFRRNTETGGTTMKCAKFIPVAALLFNEDRNTHYLSNDCLFFRVSLDTKIKDERPWLESKAEFMKYYTITPKKS